MEYDKEKKEIRTTKILNELDKFTIEFIDIAKKFVDYVIVSGYVAILLGRTRASEDVDLLIPQMKKETFVDLWEKLKSEGFECLNTTNIDGAFSMLDEHAIRFAKGLPIPNIEFKIIKTDLDKHALDNKLKVILDDYFLYVSPIELQIACKLYLGSQKDLEDAKHLHDIFKDKINKGELLDFIKELDVKDRFDLMEEYGDTYRFRDVG
ncbi:hypothetical protein CMI42_00870 [Candidatus Pacearchaeota archaeon]|jgi:hypothetical protein|nr:hypothetical protein [Candidatus Pacearchaeota archaeon]|tara:strand:+ start:58 stop:681 length:624 start_codon:yes stop_codon:yes gene_type:complete